MSRSRQSHYGEERPLCALFGLHIKSDSGSAANYLRRPSFDHLVGSGEQRRKQVKAEHACGLPVDDQLTSTTVRPEGLRVWRSRSRPGPPSHNEINPPEM